MPGRPRSSEPWITSSRLPRSGETSSSSGIHGARPRTPVTRGSSAAEIATAPPIEKPSRSFGPAPVASIAARQSSVQSSSRRQERIRYRTSANASSGEVRGNPPDEPFERGAPDPGDLLLPAAAEADTAAVAAAFVTRSSAPVGRRRGAVTSSLRPRLWPRPRTGSARSPCGGRRAASRSGGAASARRGRARGRARSSPGPPAGSRNRIVPQAA